MIAIVGDIHGEFGTLNSFINKKQPKMVLVCGDFGYWPKMDIPRLSSRGRIKKPTVPKAGDTKVYWCDGNHEDHESLLLDTKTSTELWPNVWYMKRGSVLELDDGRNILFMGGAHSVDKASRRNRIDWFEEELISWADFRRLPDPDDVRIDIVISHTCPLEVPMEGSFNAGKQDDPSRRVLSHILQVYRPNLWYFGHWHHYNTGFLPDTNCRWTALNMCCESNWWAKLPE